MNLNIQTGQNPIILSKLAFIIQFGHKINIKEESL